MNLPNLLHPDFVACYHSKMIGCHVDLTKATIVCVSPMVPKHFRLTHQVCNAFGGYILPIFAIIAFIIWPWWACFLILIFNFAVLVPSLRKTSAQHVLQFCLEDPSFYEAMLMSGTLRVFDIPRR